MAKKNGKTREVTRGNGATSPPVPAGYQQRTSEVAGFWDPALGPIHFIPRSARVFDSQIEPVKSSILVLGDSVGVNKIRANDDDKTPIDAKPNQQIGIWYKPGMAALKDLAGVPVYMYENGERDTGKPNPMKIYEVLSPKVGRPLMIVGDYRKRSVHTVLPFDMNAQTSTPTTEEQIEDGNISNEDIPF